MENKKKLGMGVIIEIIVLALLSIIGLTCIISGIKQYFGVFAVSPSFIAWVITLASIIYYALAGYKLPHGNLLRFIFLLLSLTCLNGVIDTAQLIPYHEVSDLNNLLLIIGFDGISVLLIAYVGGRLDKIKKNYLPIVLITIAQLGESIVSVFVYDSFTAFSGWSCFVQVVWSFTNCIIWFDIAFAYILRYKEHKEAGLTDKN